VPVQARELQQTRDMNPTEAIQRVKTYTSLLRLVVRHGRGEAFDASDVGTQLVQTGDSDSARSLASELEELGPTYVKLGQLLSTRADLLPPAYLEALERLQEGCEPFPAAEARRITSEELGVELGDVFRDFSEEPIGSASFSQVHTARLRDGRDVVVKVQRPDLEERVREDLDALSTLADLLDNHSEIGAQIRFGDILSQLRSVLAREMDYRQEARNLETLSENLSDRERLFVPAPVHALSTRRVLTMERVEGRKVTDLGSLGVLDLDGRELARELFEAYLDQALVDGFLHADPHPGNLILTPDGRLAIIDLGMVATVSEDQRSTLLQLLLAIAENRGADAARLSADLAFRLPEFDERSYETEITEIVQRVQGATVAEIDIGGMLLEVIQSGTRNGLRPDPKLSLLAKTLLNIDAAARTLDPQFDPQAALREHAVQLIAAHSTAVLDPRRFLALALEAQRALRKLPAGLRSLSDLIAGGEIRVRVDAIDEERLIQGLQKIANRIALGVVLAALILGAALLMRVDVGPQILGYPAVAFVLFALAVFCGLGLVVSILVTDARSYERGRRGVR